MVSDRDVCMLVSTVNMQDTPYDVHLRMAAIIPHAMTPDHLPVLEEELPSDLQQITAAELFLPFYLRELFELAVHPAREGYVLHVFGPAWTQYVQRYAHA